MKLQFIQFLFHSQIFRDKKSVRVSSELSKTHKKNQRNISILFSVFPFSDAESPTNICIKEKNFVLASWIGGINFSFFEHLIFDYMRNYSHRILQHNQKKKVFAFPLINVFSVQYSMYCNELHSSVKKCKSHLSFLNIQNTHLLRILI